MEICCIDLKQINYSPKKEIVGDLQRRSGAENFTYQHGVRKRLKSVERFQLKKILLQVY
jgi:hypothetical protein